MGDDSRTSTLHRRAPRARAGVTGLGRTLARRVLRPDLDRAALKIQAATAAMAAGDLDAATRHLVATGELLFGEGLPGPPLDDGAGVPAELADRGPLSELTARGPLAWFEGGSLDGEHRSMPHIAGAIGWPASYQDLLTDEIYEHTGGGRYRLQR